MAYFSAFAFLGVKPDAFKVQFVAGILIVNVSGLARNIEFGVVISVLRSIDYSRVDHVAGGCFIFPNGHSSFF